MDNEQKFPINLDAPLDVSSGDMPVNVQSPKFSYNRQKLIGGVLQNSVRYEADGWVAGWWVHNFDYMAMGDYSLTPNDLGELRIGKRRFIKGPRDYWAVTLRDAGLSFYWNFQNQWEQWIDGAGTVQRISDTIMRITGTTNKTTGVVTFTADCNVYTGDVISYSSSDPSLVASAYKDSGFNVFAIEVPSVFGAHYIHIRYGRDNMFTGVASEYSYDGTTHTWANLATYSGGAPVILNPEYVLQSYSVVDAGTLNEVLRVLLQCTVLFDVTCETVYTWRPVRCWPVEAGFSSNGPPSTGYLGESVGNGVKAAVNQLEIKKLSVDPNIQSPTDYITVPTKLSVYPKSSWELTAPLWCFIRIDLGMMWDGSQIHWKFGTSDRPFYFEVMNSGVQQPGLRAHLNVTDFDLGEGGPILHQMSCDSASSFTNEVLTSSLGIDDNFNIDIFFEITDPAVGPVGTQFGPRIRYSLIDNNRGGWIIPTQDHLKESHDNPYGSKPYFGYGYSYTWIDFEPTSHQNWLYPVLDYGISVLNDQSYNWAWTDVPLWRKNGLQPPPGIPWMDFSEVRRPGRQDFMWYANNRAPGANDQWGQATNEWSYNAFAFPVCFKGSMLFDLETVDVTNAVYEITNQRGPGGIHDLTNYMFLNWKAFNDGTQPSIYLNIVYDTKIVVDILCTSPLYYANVEELGDLASDGSNWIYWPKWINDKMVNTWTNYNESFGIKTGPANNMVMVQNTQYFIMLDNQFTNTIVCTPNPAECVGDKLEIQQHLANIELTYDVPGVYTQDIKIHIAPGEFITGVLDREEVSKKTPVNPITWANNIAKYNWLGITDSRVDDLHDPSVMCYNINFKMDKLYSDIQLDLFYCFVFDKLGIMTAANIVDVVAGDINLTTGYGTLTYDGQYINHPETTLQMLQTGVNDVIVYVSPANRAEVNWFPAGLFYRNNDLVHYISHTANQLRFEYMGKQYVLTINSAQESLVYTATDLRDNSVHELWRQDVTNTVLFKKQFWSDDVGVENYWWIDENHVLELSKYYFTLYVKVNAPDDWGGNRWNIEKQAPRGAFLTLADRYWACSCGYGQRAMFFKIEPQEDKLLIRYIANIGGSNWNIVQDPNVKFTTVTVPVMTVPLPGALSGTAISAFTPLDPYGIVTASDITSTARNNQLIIGFRMGRGLTQWTLKISGSGFSVVNGYGSVGLDASLTGGQIPKVCCSASNGFNASCKPLSEFKDDENKGVDNEVFSDKTNVWFVYDSVDNIVSHFQWTGSGWSMITVPMANKYNMKEEHNFWTSIGFADFEPKGLNLLSLILDQAGNGNGNLGVFTSLMSKLSDIAAPSYWHLKPLMMFSTGVVASVSQVASVTLNSTSGVKLKDGKNANELIVNRRRFKKSQNIDLGSITSGINTIIALAPFARTIAWDTVSAINQEQCSNVVNQSESRTFAANLMNTITELTVRPQYDGFMLNANGNTLETISLDMFYSITDNTECWSGPGFVNHNFMSVVRAQSLSCNHVLNDRIRIVIPLMFITQMLVGIQYAAADAICNGIEWAMNNVKELTVFGGINIGAAIAAVMLVALKAADIYRNMLKVMNDKGVEAFYDSFGGSSMRVSFPGGTYLRNVDAEGAHTYGTKPYSLFWPAYGVNEPDTVILPDVEGAIRYTDISCELKTGSGMIPIKRDGFCPNKVCAKFSDNFGAKYAVATGSLKNKNVKHTMAPNMAVVEGITEYLTDSDNFKNIQINVPHPQFTVPPIMDYKITAHNWDLCFNASMGKILSVGVGDTKVIDGPPSNIVSTGSFLGIASSYTAIECSDFDETFLRPVAVTSQAIGLNITGMNAVQEARVYHAFDSQFNRIVSWKGGTGLDAAGLNRQYSFVINNYFKRSNIVPPSEFLGRFESVPKIAIKTYGESVYNFVTRVDSNADLPFNVSGEDRDSRRYSIPVHSDILQTLPGMMRTIGPYPLAVMEGVTSLTTELRNANPAGKAPNSVDFAIYEDIYRMTDEYIGKIERKSGLLTAKSVTPSAGLILLGPSTQEAFLYSPATRHYYSFGGGQEINKKDVLSRFVMADTGRWDFVNQEVVFRCRIDDNILKDDTHGNIICRIDGEIAGELYPPPPTIYSERSGFKILSMNCGLVYQGPKRCVVNRFIIQELMYDQIKANKGLWKKLDRYDWDKARDYGWEYIDYNTYAPPSAVFGWTHNPYRLATAMFAVDDETDCKFEWELVFCWTEQMERIWEQNEYITVNIAGETVGQGGRLLSDPTHLFLYKELFKTGYYSTRYHSGNGIGSRERLLVWGDGLQALQHFSVYCKELTKKRTQPLVTSQVDILELTEQ